MAYWPGVDIHVAHRRIWSWIVSISLPCSVRRSASIVSPASSMRRPALTALLLPTPPYNIEKTGEDAYRLTMAVAGFSPAELEVTVQENTLLVTGKAQKEDENGSGYLHRGIARRSFERRFSLADHMKVTGASLDNGLLHVDVVREVPEAAKPRTIKIGTTVETVQPQVTQQKAA